MLRVCGGPSRTFNDSESGAWAERRPDSWAHSDARNVSLKWFVFKKNFTHKCRTGRWRWAACSNLVVFEIKLCVLGEVCVCARVWPLVLSCRAEVDVTDHWDSVFQLCLMELLLAAGLCYLNTRTHTHALSAFMPQALRRTSVYARREEQSGESDPLCSDLHSFFGVFTFRWLLHALITVWRPFLCFSKSNCLDWVYSVTVSPAGGKLWRLYFNKIGIWVRSQS